MSRKGSIHMNIKDFLLNSFGKDKPTKMPLVVTEVTNKGILIYIPKEA